MPALKVISHQAPQHLNALFLLAVLLWMSLYDREFDLAMAYLEEKNSRRF
mgnify:FL=1